MEVAVHQGQLLMLRGRGDQPSGQVVEVGRFAGLGQLPLPGPALQLTLRVGLVAGQIVQADCLDVDGVDFRQGLG